MAHELSSGIDPQNTSGPASIYAIYIKTDVDEEDWDRAVMGFTAVQRRFKGGRFHCDRVLGGPELAKAIARVIRQHQDEILRECGFVHAEAAHG
jgi:hypothetical protein